MTAAADYIARRVVAELPDGACVNLGIGLPGQVLRHLPAHHNLWLQSETGLLGYQVIRPLGLREDWHLQGEYIDANGNIARVSPGGAILDLADTFGWMRTGRVDVAVLGAYQVDAAGRLASWSRGPQRETGMGGAMELLAGARRVIVAMEHLDRQGRPRIVDRLTLPATATRGADLIVTEKCVIEVTPDGLNVRDLADGVTVEHLRSATLARLNFVAESVRSAIRQEPPQ